MKRTGWLVLVGGGLVIVLLALSLIGPLVSGNSSGSYGGAWGYGMMRGLGFPIMGMMGIGMILFWVFIIGGAVSLVQPLVRGSSTTFVPPPGESPLDIVKTRYSRGEISKEQFEDMQRDLRQ